MRKKNLMNNEKLTYFIKSKDFVKIGSSVDPQTRLKELQTANQQPLELLCTTSIPEREIQDKFKLYHKQGEWYFLSNEIKEFIDHIILESHALINQNQLAQDHSNHLPRSNDLLEVIKIITEMDSNKKGRPIKRFKTIYKYQPENESPKEIKKRHKNGTYSIDEILRQMKMKGLNYSPLGFTKLLENVIMIKTDYVLFFPAFPLKVLEGKEKEGRMRW